jgi:hypothetical protein
VLIARCKKWQSQLDIVRRAYKLWEQAGTTGMVWACPPFGRYREKSDMERIAHAGRK